MSKNIREAALVGGNVHKVMTVTCDDGFPESWVLHLFSKAITL